MSGKEIQVHYWPGNGCPKCGKTLKKTHDEFINEMKEANTNIEIIGEYVNSHTRILCRCKIDNYEWQAFPHNLLRKKGCPVCCNRTVMYKVNDITTTDPDFAKLFVDIDDAKNNLKGSNNKAWFKCPDCGKQYYKIIHQVAANGICCDECRDKISYPNKYLRSLIMQATVENYIFEYNPKWARPYSYDCYFEKNGTSYIVEMDGSFHFNDNNMSGQTAEEVQTIDRIKDAMAAEHNIKLIRIDCKKSDGEYIKNNIVNSELINIINLNEIDFELCDKEAHSNFIKKFCEYFEANKTDKTIIDIVKKFGITLTTFVKYYTKGIKYEWCS